MLEVPQKSVCLSAVAPAAKFFWYFLFTLLTLLFFTYYGMMSVAISPNIQLAAIMSGSVYSIWFVFAGFFIPYAAMPVWWSWFYWLNPLSYMLYGIITSQLGDVQTMVELQPGQMVTIQELLKGKDMASWWCTAQGFVLSEPQTQ